MATYVIYDVNTGNIKRNVVCAPKFIEINLHDKDERFLEVGHRIDNRFYKVVDTEKRIRIKEIPGAREAENQKREQERNQIAQRKAQRKQTLQRAEQIARNPSSTPNEKALAEIIVGLLGEE